MLSEASHAECDGVQLTCAGTGRLNGRSEQLLGRFIAESPAKRRTRDGILVATKLAAYPWRVTPAQYVQACRCAQPGLTAIALGTAPQHGTMSLLLAGCC